MKSYHYHGTESKVLLSDGTEIFGKGVNEITVEFHPKGNTMDYRAFPLELQRGISLEFKFNIPKLDIYEDKMMGLFYEPYPTFRHIEIVIPNRYITDDVKRDFYKLQDHGFLIVTGFRQEIHPKLQAHISFLTMMKIEQKELDSNEFELVFNKETVGHYLTDRRNK